MQAPAVALSDQGHGPLTFTIGSHARRNGGAQLLVDSVGPRTATCPPIQVVDIFDVEIVSLRKIPATTIHVCRLAAIQNVDEAGHLRSRGTLVDPHTTEFVAEHSMNVKSKDTGIRELYVLFASDRGA